MKIIVVMGLAVFLAGCAADGGYTGTARGFQGAVNTIWADVGGVSTTYSKDEKPMQATVTPDGGQTDMVSTMKSRPDGSFEMTGPGVFWQGMAAFCRVAVASPLCGANPPVELFAALPSGN